MSPSSPKCRQRIDRVLVERGWARDLREAQALLLRGKVRVDDVRVTKAGTAVPADAEVRVAGFKGGFISRGGMKLEAALLAFAVAVPDRIAMDVGASYGGFTDCLLQFGARYVYAVDAGAGQLARRLAGDPRVKDLGGCNLSDVTVADLTGGPPTLATVDLSYLSLSTALAEVDRILGPGLEVVALFKPLYEVRKPLDVRAPELYQQSAPLIRRLADCHPMRALMLSPVAGAGGALEFFLHFAPADRRVTPADVDAVIGHALRRLAEGGDG